MNLNLAELSAAAEILALIAHTPTRGGTDDGWEAGVVSRRHGRRTATICFVAGTWRWDVRCTGPGPWPAALATGEAATLGAAAGAAEAVLFGTNPLYPLDIPF